AQWSVLHVGEVEQLVPNQLASNRSAEAILVVARVAENALIGIDGIQRVQIAILEVFIDRSVSGVRAALDHGVELAAAGVSELGADLVLKQREFGGGFRRDVHQRTGYRLIVVVHALDREIVIHGPLAADRRSRALPYAAVRGNAGAQ